MQGRWRSKVNSTRREKKEEGGERRRRGVKNWGTPGRQLNVLYGGQILHDDGDLAGCPARDGPLGSRPVGRRAVSRQRIMSCRYVPPVSSVVPQRSSGVAVAASTKEGDEKARARRQYEQRAHPTSFVRVFWEQERCPPCPHSAHPLSSSGNHPPCELPRPSTPSTDLIYVTTQIRPTTDQRSPTWQSPVFFVSAQV
jgi:hypothetical protein